MLVLDEADRMLDMGFTPQVRKIVGEIKGPRQTVMFSATINKAVARSGEEFLTDPITVAVNSDRVEPISIEQKIHLVQEEGKTQLLVDLLNEPMNDPLNDHLIQRTVLAIYENPSSGNKDLQKSKFTQKSQPAKFTATSRKTSANQH